MVMTLLSNPKGSVATIIVAADGSGDTTDIQAGINMLPAAGGVVYIREGTYIITATITIPNSNISLIGAGRSTIIEAGIAGLCMIRATGLTGIFIDKLFLFGDNSVNNFGIELDSCFSCFINNNWLDTMDIGIRLINACLAISIFNNNLQGCLSYGIYINGGSRNNLILNSLLNLPSEGIYLDSVSQSIIIANSSSNNTLNGINLVNSSNIIIEGNETHTNAQYGIIIDVFSDRNIVVGNIALNNTMGQINNLGTNIELAHNIIV